MAIAWTAILSRKQPSKNVDRPVNITVYPRKFLTGLFLICTLVVAGLFLGDWIINYTGSINSGPIQRLFNITREDGLASWVAITITSLVALSIWALWALARASKASKFVQRGWLIIAGFFTYLAVDDGAMIHERLGSALADAPASGWLANFPSYYWQLIFLPILIIFGGFFLYFLARQLHTPKQKLAVIVALGMLGLAIVLDFFEGLHPAHSLNIYTALTNGLDFSAYAINTFGQTEYNTLVHFSKSIEESLEILAMSLLWVVMLAHMFTSYPRINIKALAEKS